MRNLKLLFLLCVMLVSASVGNAWAADTEFSYSVYNGKGGISGVGGPATANVNGVTIFSTQAYYSATDGHVREYKNSEITISASVNITKILITVVTGNNNYAESFGGIVSSGTYSYTGTIGTWIGESQSVKFKTTAQSRWTKIVVTTDDPSKQTYTVQWSVNGDDNYAETTETEGYTVKELPATPAAPATCNDKVFVGWTDAPITDETDSKPAILFKTANASPTITTKTTFYAVFAKQEGESSTDYAQVMSLQDITEGVYVIVNAGYYLPSTTTTAPVKNGDTEVPSQLTSSSVTNSMKWYFTSTTTENTFYIKNSEGQYLYATNNNNGLRVNTTNHTWKFDVNTSAPAFSMKDNTADRYCATYADGSDWRSYTTAAHSNYGDNGKIYLYKEPQSTTFTSYTTTCSDLVQPGTPTITATPESIDFGSVKVGTTVEGQTFTVSGENLVGNQLSLTLSDNANFTISPATINITDGTVEPTTITVTPVSTEQAGTYNATVAVSGGDAEEKTVALSLVVLPTYTVTWSVDGNTTTQTDIAGTELQAPVDITPCDGMVFVGWTTATINGRQANAPELLNIANATIPEQDITYYAVFAKEALTNGAAWQLCSTETDLTEGVYVITYQQKNSDDIVYLPSEKAGATPTAGTGITMKNNQLTNTVTPDMQWSFKGDNTNGWTISHITSGDTYYLTSENKTQGINIVTKLENNTNYTWKASVDNEYGMLLKGSDDGSRYLAVYASTANGTNTWRYYTKNNNDYKGNLRLFKNTTTTTLSDYLTDCSNIATIESIKVTAQPNKTAYIDGESFDANGMVVTAVYNDDTEEDITEYTYYPADALVAGEQTEQNITITYKEFTTTTTINVYSVTLKAQDENGTTLDGKLILTRDVATLTAAAEQDNYVFVKWQVENATINNKNTLYNPQGNITATAIYHSPISVTWSVNGKTTTTEERYSKVATFNVTDNDIPGCAEVFVGWSQTEIGSKPLNGEDVDALNLTTTPFITEKTILYAVFATTIDRTPQSASATFGVNAKDDVQFPSGTNNNSLEASGYLTKEEGYTKDLINVVIDKGSNTSYPVNLDNAVRFYLGSYVYVNPICKGGQITTIKQVEFVRLSNTSSNDGTIICNELTASASNTSTNTNVFTGSAISRCSFTNDAQCRFTQIKISYEYATYSNFITNGDKHSITLADEDGFAYNGETLVGVYKVDETEACEYSKVVITPVAEDGYHFAGVEVYETNNPENKLESGDMIDVDLENEEAFFLMPNFDVTVAVIFLPDVAEKNIIRDNLYDGKWGTLCPAQNYTEVEGATFYQISYVEDDADGMPYNMVFDAVETTTLSAGQPYYFIANADQITGNRTGDKLTEATPANGLYGNISGLSITLRGKADYEPEADDNYFVINDNKVVRIAEDGEAEIPNERCYIVINNTQPSRQPVAAVPNRSRVMMNIQVNNTANGMQMLNAADQPMKMLIDGQIYILRANRMYDTTGRQVK